MDIDGVDVSHHQGAIDWSKMAGGGKRYAVIRCSFGTVEDEMFEGYRRGATRKGLVAAAYCFGRSDEDAKHQADAALEIAGDLGIFLDIEPWTNKDDELVPKISLPEAEAFVRRVDKRGLYLGTYTSSGVFGSATSSLLARFPLWVAHYNVAKPRLPRNWTKWAIWQHSSKGSGKDLGAESKFVDLDRYRGTLASLKEWFSGKVDSADQSGDVDATPGEAEPVQARQQEEPTPAWPGYNFVSPSPHVRRWQRRMRRLGFKLTVDGVYGKDSREACEKFQRRHGLDDDGIVGEDTWNAAFE